MEEIASATAAAYRCTCGDVAWSAVPYPPTVNDPGMASLVLDVAQKLFSNQGAAGALRTSDVSETAEAGGEGGVSKGGRAVSERGGSCSEAAGLSGPDKADESVSGGGWFAPGGVRAQLLDQPSMAAEDFSFYAQELPSVMTFLVSLLLCLFLDAPEL